MILGKVNITTKFDDLKLTDFKDNEISFQVLIEELAKNGAIIWVDGCPAYLDEIRADYVNKEIYLPVYKEDTVDDIEYNCRLEKYVIHTFKEGYKTDKLIIQHNIASKVAYVINLIDRPLLRELDDTDRQAKGLFDRYLAYCYGYTKFENDVFKYKSVKKSNLTRKKREKLKELGLDYYGDYLDTDYRDVRQWKASELINRFDAERLKMDMTFEVRRLQFELELYLRLFSRIYWNNWTIGTINDILNDKRDFLKYKENSIYLIFKKKWIC